MIECGSDWSGARTPISGSHSIGKVGLIHDFYREGLGVEMEDGENLKMGPCKQRMID